MKTAEKYDLSQTHSPFQWSLFLFVSQSFIQWFLPLQQISLIRFSRAMPERLVSNYSGTDKPQRQHKDDEQG